MCAVAAGEEFRADLTRPGVYPKRPSAHGGAPDSISDGRDLSTRTIVVNTFSRRLLFGVDAPPVRVLYEQLRSAADTNHPLARSLLLVHSLRLLSRARVPLWRVYRYRRFRRIVMCI